MIGPLIFGLFFFGLLASRSVDKPDPASAPPPGPPPLPPPWATSPASPAPPVTVTPAMVACGKSVAGLPEPLRSSVMDAIVNPATTPEQLRALAKDLDVIAASPIYPIEMRSAANATALCVRARANEIEAQSGAKVQNKIGGAFAGMAGPGAADTIGPGGLGGAGDGSGGFGS